MISMVNAESPGRVGLIGRLQAECAVVGSTVALKTLVYSPRAGLIHTLDLELISHNPPRISISSIPEHFILANSNTFQILTIH